MTDGSDPGTDADAAHPAPESTCAHCGLPVPAGLVELTRAEQFCCHGCRTVYAVIHGCGLERFYEVRAETGEAAPARTTARHYAEFDDPVFRRLYVQQFADGSESVELYLEGIHCAACVWLVERLPRVAPGVIEARLDMRRGLVRVRWDDTQICLSRVAAALDSLGYPPHPAKDARAREMRRREDHRFLIRIGVAAACAGNVMTLAFALYGGDFFGMEAAYSDLFRWTSMVFGLIALLWPGNLFLRGAWAALRTRTAHLDLPIALGMLAGGVAGTVNAILGRGEIYFDSLTMLVFLLLVGRWIQRRQQRWASDALELLFAVTPTSANRVEREGIRQVPLEALGPGDLVEVRAGESIPIDGVVEDGRSTIDQSLLTGESRGVAVDRGDRVHAGATNLAARLRVRVEAVGDQTRVGRLMELVEQCSRDRAPIVRLADQVAGWFVILVLTLAVMTFALWMWLDPQQAVDHSVALLIVSCPCALGLATPLAVTVAIGRAARRGILIKGGETLELLARQGQMFLDKTGTLTVGRTSVVSWNGDSQVRPWVAALESHSAHPVAQALCASTDAERTAVDVPADSVKQVVETTGGGISGRVRDKSLVVGSPRFLRSREVSISPEMIDFEREAVASGATPILVAVDGCCVAVVGLGDPIRDDVPQAVHELGRLGWKTRILSGDHPDVVKSVGEQLGLPAADCLGGRTPEEKVAFVKTAVESDVAPHSGAHDGADWAERGRRTSTVMVGDGVNDAGALAAATVGIAVHGGAEASLSAADAYLSRPGLSPIVELVHAARNTLRTIRRSLVVSLCYNALAAALAMTGVIGPLVAAVLMPISSFTVLAMAYSSRTFGDGN